MKTIYKDHNGLTVNVAESDDCGCLGVGHNYTVDFGAKAHGKYSLGPAVLSLDFQFGPAPSMGVNGITNEALLAILIHRTEILDAQFGCDENKRAVYYMKNALVNFELRTANRTMRGVEGKLEV